MPELKLLYLNQVNLVGRLVAEPHKLTANGDRTGAAFTLAVNRYRQGAKSVSTFIDCCCWGQPAEFLLAHCAKGSAVAVFGSLAQYEKKQPKGPPVKQLQVSVVTVQLLDRKDKDDHDVPDAPDTTGGA